MIHSECPLIPEGILGRGPMDMREPFRRTLKEDKATVMEDEIMATEVTTRRALTIIVGGLIRQTHTGTIRTRPQEGDHLKLFLWPPIVPRTDSQGRALKTR